MDDALYEDRKWLEQQNEQYVKHSYEPVDIQGAQEYEALMDSIEDWFGDDVIIVHKPKGTDYFITISSNAPVETKQILMGIVERFQS